VRVTGGRYRGRRLQVPPRDIRPVTDRMREALFNVLAARGTVLDGCRFLDLFSGSGIMAVEAASRGAVRVDLVERDPRKRPYLQRNTSFVAAAVTIHVTPCERFLARAQRAANGGWDLVFVDPPYAYRRKEDLLTALAACAGLRAGALVVVHTQVGEVLAAPPRLPCIERRRYGGAALALFAAAEPKPEQMPSDHP
jgi:16S rRNA (guanine(966)-N(2))-methyltransferase RsmD